MAPTYFDSTAFIGKKLGSPRYGEYDKRDETDIWTAEELLAEMDHAHISAALVTHSYARWYDCAFGNRKLMAEIADHPRLLPCWILVPHFAREMPRPQKLLDDMEEAGVRAAKILPKNAIMPLRPELWGCLLGALEDERIPLFLERSEQSWEELFDLLTRHRDLPVVLQRAGWGEQRVILAALERFPNLHIDFSCLQANRFVEHAVDRFGPFRFVFGTDLPLKNPGAARAYVDYARITDTAREVIASGNLARLLGVDVPEITFKHPESELLAAAMEGRPLDDVNVIDAHAHVLHDDANGAGHGYIMFQGDAKGMHDLNQTMGIDRCCVSSWLGITVDQAVGSNITADVVRQFPEHFIGYATIEPVYTKDMGAEIRRVHEELGLLGLKPYWPSQGHAYDCEQFAPWFEYANERRLFALLHQSGGNYFEQVRNLATKYPEVSFFTAHTGSSVSFCRGCIDVARDCPNVYLEITYTAARLGTIELMVRELGAERVLFGTDAPMRDPRPQFGWLLYSHLTDDERRLILGGNMAKILERVKATR